MTPRYAAARKIAQSHGFRFLPADVVAKLPIAEFTARLQTCEAPNAVIDPVPTSKVLRTLDQMATYSRFNLPKMATEAWIPPRKWDEKTREIAIFRYLGCPAPLPSRRFRPPAGGLSADMLDDLDPDEAKIARLHGSLPLTRCWWWRS